MNQRRTFFPSSTAKKKASLDSSKSNFRFLRFSLIVQPTFFIIFAADDVFLAKHPTTDNSQHQTLHKKSSSRNRTISAADPDTPISTFEALTINTQIPDNGKGRETSPSSRARRFSGNIVLPSSSSTSEPIEPSLFSPGSVRARTASSLQDKKDAPTSFKYQNSLPSAADEASSVALASQRLINNLFFCKTLQTSDFIHSDQQQNPPSNDTARNKLLQTVYIKNANSNPTSLSESLTNGTNSHTHPTDSSSNCVVS